MHQIKIGAVTISKNIQRDGLWREPEDIFPAYNLKPGKQHTSDGDRFRCRFIR